MFEQMFERVCESKSEGREWGKCSVCELGIAINIPVSLNLHAHWR